jgi:hypothetical protein
MMRHFLILTLIITGLAIACTVIVRSKTELDYFHHLQDGVPEMANLVGQQYFLQMQPAAFTRNLNQHFQAHPTLVFQAIKDPANRLIYFRDGNHLAQFDHSAYHDTSLSSPTPDDAFYLVSYGVGINATDPLIIYRAPIHVQGSFEGSVELGFDGRILVERMNQSMIIIFAFAGGLIVLTLLLLFILSRIHRTISASTFPKQQQCTSMQPRKPKPPSHKSVPAPTHMRRIDFKQYTLSPPQQPAMEKDLPTIGTIHLPSKVLPDSFAQKAQTEEWKEWASAQTTTQKAFTQPVEKPRLYMFASNIEESNQASTPTFLMSKKLGNE